MVRRAAFFVVFAFIATICAVGFNDPAPVSAAEINVTASCGSASYVGGRLQQQFNVTINGPAVGTNQVFSTSGFATNVGTFHYMSTSPSPFETPYPFDGTMTAAFADDVFNPSTPPTNPPGGSTVQYTLGAYISQPLTQPNPEFYHVGSVVVDCSVPVNDTLLVANDFSLAAVSGQSKFDYLDAHIAGGSAPFTFSVVTPPTNGTVTLVTEPQSDVLKGAYRYRTNKGTAGTDSFVYQVTDAAGTTKTATATITYAAPTVLVAAPKTLAIPYNSQTAKTVALTATGGISPRVFSLVTTSPSSKGTFSLTGTTFSYTPAANATGTDTITYRVTDGTDPAQNVTGTITVTIAPPPVVAGDGTLAVDYEGEATGDLSTLTSGGLAPIAYTLESAPTKGEVSFSTGGGYTYTANDGATGADSFTYRASDASTIPLTDTGVITVTIAPEPLTGQDSSLTVEAGQSTTLDLGTLVDGGTAPLSFAVSTPGKGSASVAGAVVSYTADADERGTDAFTYTATDSGVDPYDQSVTKTITVTITDPPIVIVQPVSQTVIAGQSFTIDLASNATGGTGDLTYTVTDDGVKGVGTLTGTSLTYVANAADRGADAVTIDVTDESDPTQTGTITVNIQINAPQLVVTGTTANVIAGQGVDIELAGLITGGTGPFTVTIETDGTKGTATVDGTTVTYAANAADRGADTVTFRVTDVSDPEQSTTADITITINAPELILGNPAQTVVAGQTLTLDLSTLVTGGTPTFAYDIVTDPANGTFDLTGSTFTYTPDSTYRGAASFEFEVTDGSDPVQTKTATIAVTVQAPQLVVSGTSQAVTAGQSVDIDIAPLISGGTGPFTVTIETDGLKGTATVDDLVVTYAANAADRGTDTVTFRVTDVSDPEQSLTADIALQINAPTLVLANPAQTVTAGQTLSLDLSTLVTGGTPDFSYDVITGPGNGTFDLTGSTFTYTPDSTYRGPESLTFQVTDTSDPVQSPTATIAITVTAPTLVLAPASVSVLAGDSVDIDLAALVSGGTAPYAYSIDTDGSKGTSSLIGTTLTYTANEASRGLDTVTFQVTDASDPMQSPTQDITITITAPDLVTGDTSATVTAGDAVSVDLSGLVSGGTTPYAFSVDTDGSKGSSSLAGSTLTYTADVGTAGSDSVEITVSDASDPQQSGTIVVAITIIAPDLVTGDTSATVTAGDAVSIDLSGLVSGGTMPYAYSIDADGAKGSSSLSGATLTYTANANASGSDSVEIAVSDASNPQQSGTIVASITIEAPTLDATGTSLDVAYDGTGSVDLASLVSGGTTPYAFAIEQGPASGNVILGGSTAIYIPNSGFSGTDQFSYSVTDGSNPQQIAGGTITITVADAPPVDPIGDQQVSVTGDPRFPIVGSAAISGVPGLSYTLGTAPNEGSVIVGSDGQFTYAANPTLAPSDRFTVIARDGQGNTATITVTVYFEIDKSVSTKGTVSRGDGTEGTGRDPRSTNPSNPTPTPEPEEDDDADDCVRCG